MPVQESKPFDNNRRMKTKLTLAEMGFIALDKNGDRMTEQEHLQRLNDNIIVLNAGEVACNLCGRVFYHKLTSIAKFNTRRHVETHMPGVSYTCPAPPCRKHFKTKMSLQKHLERTPEHKYVSSIKYEDEGVPMSTTDYQGPQEDEEMKMLKNLKAKLINSMSNAAQQSPGTFIVENPPKEEAPSKISFEFLSTIQSSM